MSNEWRPLGEVVKWGVPCEFEWRGPACNGVYKWDGEHSHSKIGRLVEFGCELLHPNFRLHVPETVESVLDNLRVKIGYDPVNDSPVNRVYVAVRSNVSLEHMKRIAAKIVELDALIKE